MSNQELPKRLIPFHRRGEIISPVPVWKTLNSAHEEKTFLHEQKSRWGEMTSLISSEYSGLSTIIGIDKKVLLGPELQELAFRSTTHGYIREKLQDTQEEDPKELNILVVNYGNSQRDITLPVEIAEDNKDSENQINIKFLRDPAQTPSCREEFSTDSCRFSTITEDELAKEETPYDLVLIYAPDEDTTGKIRQFRARERAGLLIGSLEEKGRIIISADKPQDITPKENTSGESLNFLLGELLGEMDATNSVPLTKHGSAEFIYMDPVTEIPSFEVSNNAVVSLSFDNSKQKETVKLSKTRKRRRPLVIGGIAAGAAVAAATGIFFASSSQGEPGCPPGTVELTPAQPSAGTTIFKIPDGPEVKVTIHDGYDSSTSSAWEGELQWPSNYTGEIDIPRTQTKLDVYTSGNEVLGCVSRIPTTETPTPSNSETVPSSSAT